MIQNNNIPEEDNNMTMGYIAVNHAEEIRPELEEKALETIMSVVEVFEEQCVAVQQCIDPVLPTAIVKTEFTIASDKMVYKTKIHKLLGGFRFEADVPFRPNQSSFDIGGQVIAKFIEAEANRRLEHVVSGVHVTVSYSNQDLHIKINLADRVHHIAQGINGAREEDIIKNILYIATN